MEKKGTENRRARERMDANQYTGSRGDTDSMVCLHGWVRTISGPELERKLEQRDEAEEIRMNKE